MYSTLLKRSFFLLSLFALVALACDMTVNTSPSAATNPAPLPTNTLLPTTAAPIQIAATPTAIPPTLAPSTIMATLPTAVDDIEAIVDPLRIILPHHVASGVSGQQ